MVKEIVFHLGDRKTGSTSIQGALASGNWTSTAGTICYPSKGNHNPLAKSLAARHEHKFQKQRFNRVARKIAGSDADIAVISAENFESVNPQDLQKAITEYLPDFRENLRLIVYVRPHAERLVSGFAERTKQGGFLGSLEDFHELTKANNTFSYLSRLTKWRKVFGDKLEIRPMIRSLLYKDCVVHDFLHFALNGAEISWPKDSASNESLSLQDLALLRELQKTLGGKEAHKAAGIIGWEFARIISALPDPAPAEKLRLHKSLLPDVVKTYQKDATALDKRFFTGTPMADALAATKDKTIDIAQSLELADHVSGDELRRLTALSTLVAKMFAAEPEIWPKHLRNRKQD